jgi:hypothetical protein
MNKDTTEIAEYAIWSVKDGSEVRQHMALQ